MYKIANSGDWKPWVLQSVLREKCENVVSVGDDLSFTVKLEFEISESIIEKLREIGRESSIYPFKRAFRFDSGFVAVNGRFIRLSRNLDEKTLVSILNILFD